MCGISPFPAELFVTLTGSGFSRRWRGRDARPVRVGWIFRFLLSLDRARLPDESIAGLVSCEEIVVCSDGIIDIPDTRTSMH
jgi:hypothetical protein